MQSTHAAGYQALPPNQLRFLAEEVLQILPVARFAHPPSLEQPASLGSLRAGHVLLAISLCRTSSQPPISLIYVRAFTQCRPRHQHANDPTSTRQLRFHPTVSRQQADSIIGLKPNGIMRRTEHQECSLYVLFALWGSSKGIIHAADDAAGPACRCAEGNRSSHHWRGRSRLSKPRPGLGG
ncbi:hypothetical protein BSY17_4131 (plasmid) [Sphingobium sp. RAC03]|nr:hypothetical protein BSY17_4131 [Sphingobium sp. RAC03]